MKVAIDCRMLGDHGIGTYLYNILINIIPNKQHFFLLIGDPNKLKEFKVYNNCEIIPLYIKPFSLKEILYTQTDPINECDIYYSPNFNFLGNIKIPIALTIHDLVFLDIKGFTSLLGKAIRYLFVLRAIKRAKMLFTVSQFSANRIKSTFNIKQNKIIITYNGINKELTKFTPTKLEKDSFFIYIGNIKPHKGITTLLKAFQILKLEGDRRKLYIVGEYNSFKTKSKNIIKLINHDKDIIFTGKISNTDLYNLLYNADALIQPSTYEGFGIPPLEALFLKTPAIISDIPVFKEIYSNLPVYYFEVNNPRSLAQAMKSISEEKCYDHLYIPYNYEKTSEIILSSLSQII